MKRIYLWFVCIGLLFPLSGYGQKVYKEGSAFVLNLSEAAGMPAGAQTSVHKYTGNYTASNTEYLVNQNLSDSENKQVYYKLQVSEDMLYGGDATSMDWAIAYEICKTKLDNDWRLPTQRELQLIYIFRNTFMNKLGMKEFGLQSYWSITENTSSKAWIVDFTNGETNVKDKDYGFGKVRCVREM